MRPPADVQRQFWVDELLRFEIVLIGRATTLLPYFALALQQLERQGLGQGRARVKVIMIEALWENKPRLTEDGYLPHKS